MQTETMRRKPSHTKTNRRTASYFWSLLHNLSAFLTVLYYFYISRTMRKMLQIRELCYTHPEVMETIARGDQARADQTKHDWDHLCSVRDMAMRLTSAITLRYPRLLSFVERLIIIPLGAFFHDIGSFDEPRHDIVGGRFTAKFLRALALPCGTTLGLAEIKRITRIVVYHRSHRYLEKRFSDLALDVVFLADKAVGDESRVRDNIQLQIKKLVEEGHPELIDTLLDKGIHDRVNYSIKSSDLVIEESTIILRMVIDERVAKPKDIYGLFGNPNLDEYSGGGGPIHGNRYHCCITAARNLGFDFALEFNGVKYRYSPEKLTWVADSAAVIPIQAESLPQAS